MYLFINIPIISEMEWHPFTIESNPNVNYITIYIKNVGRWTNTLYDLVKCNYNFKNIYIDGPINSPSEKYLEYDKCIMIATGIGITPFLPIIQDILIKFYNYKKMNINTKESKKVFSIRL
jgi:predicted ferric reductase